jgi:hypothetical protein
VSIIPRSSYQYDIGASLPSSYYSKTGAASVEGVANIVKSSDFTVDRKTSCTTASNEIDIVAAQSSPPPMPTLSSLVAGHGVSVFLLVYRLYNLVTPSFRMQACQRDLRHPLFILHPAF